ncbi:hypothetical protein A2454_01535 [Candidatus Peribacteria bacterium RIFOXYC2_FULL_55_14]|nr:MAG: hypothetical protein UY85_C0033G0010 [Candidatus Peribacteria bacterium GW2011_GWB1_54_5]OGJ72861.1 MAG: hypothetical protein A2198_00650 [Candidatus Peribacteria bacterium RIFOXYA1_FULL_56_14]OGJ73408.1 MAG: hypothetical protein A2217_01715 [Candidatus Peribacteria bacterium RIFOXYA2_FULL_55_28]OGJ74590.1 MAG: hypothetical protein A2384_03005 [Candidatus Peribacteria bacterium RIFOXYB1_FULL_54_35]OGJ77636.1 MAG: hypothetical protein A2327_05355 [Candidatus Peribacteria bacterium RIFOXY
MDTEALGIPLTQKEQYRLLLHDCYEHASTSNHPSTHNAALLVRDGTVVLRGVNRLPPGVRALPERFEGENKHKYPNHAERDAIYGAARKGIQTESLTMVMPWLPCIPCANAIITAGIRTLIVHKQMMEKTNDRWKEELAAAVGILQEAGISIFAYDGTVGKKSYMHDQWWDA